ncbi:alpha/beta fold hydrolase [Vibrio agarivorans]|uniref:alpha/beta fold hydrolase n=1 Tax=Vibrio agarivorans TaxID=153622 RepID=UPI00222E4EFA|nr:alpha/beta hydrolase [Vibrio agarivorans]
MSFSLSECHINKKVQLEWGILAYRDYQPAQADPNTPTVVFLHGWLDNAASFDSTVVELIKLLPNIRCIAVDLAGHGWSDHKSLGQYYGFHEYLDDFSQLLSKLSANRCLIVGHSLGALLASCYSAAFPEHVMGLVQIEGLLPIAENPDNHATRIRQAVISRQRIRQKSQKSMDSFARAIAKRTRANQLTPEQITPLVARGTVEHEGRWFWRHDRRLLAESIYRMSPEHAQAIVEQVQCPWILILGSQGYPTLKSQWKSYLDADKVVTINGGHHCHLEQPQQVATIISGLVNKI